MDPACETFGRTAARGPAPSPRAVSGTPRPAPPGPAAAPARFPHPARAERAACAASAKPDSETAGPRGAESLSAAEVEAAVSRWGDTVLRLARSRMGNAADAEDVFQTVFLRLFQSGARFADDEHAKAWLLRVTANCCNDAHRARGGGAARRSTRTRSPRSRRPRRAARRTSASIGSTPPSHGFPASSAQPCTCTTSKATPPTRWRRSPGSARPPSAPTSTARARPFASS